MNQKPPVDRKDIVFFLEVLSRYCVFYFGEEEGSVLYNYYHDNHGDVITAIKKGKRVYGAKLPKLDMIFRKINVDVFFDQTEIYHIRWPYDKGEVKQVDFELFELTCFNFYEALGEFRNEEERLKLGFARRILDLLLPPKKDWLFNHDEKYNKNMALLEQLYAELKKRSPDILEEYGKNFWQLTKDEFSAYIFRRVQKTPQHLINFLWYRIKDD